MPNLALRGYTAKQEEIDYSPFSGYPDPPMRHARVLVFDTETTLDPYQNLKIGYFWIVHSSCLVHAGLFYDRENLDEQELKTLQSYAEEKSIPLYRMDEFIDEVFYPEIFRFKTLCVGFNLPFDLSRLAKRSGNSRGKNRGGFTVTLSDDSSNPEIVIKKLGLSFNIKFSKNKANLKEKYFPGNFLDVQNLAEVLLQHRRISLGQACERLNTKVKKLGGIEHGRVTENYIEYLITDVIATYYVYEKLVQELDLYGITIPITKIYSAASMGKHALTQMNIKPFTDFNHWFPKENIGQMMTAYYGGRCECRIRKTPTKVTVLDFTSMYPTVTLLMDLWSFLIADCVDYEYVTEEIRELLSHIDLEYLRKKDRWKDFVVLVKVLPNEDILPARMAYNPKERPFNVGINFVISEQELWYALPDVIASVLLTGKVPKVIEAIKFITTGTQRRLRTAEILGVTVDPRKDNLIQVLVEERQSIKQQLKTLDQDHSDYQHLTSRAQAIKILVNAMSYGIFIELNREDTKSSLDIFGLDSFETELNHYEREGKYFHPLLGVMITAGSRLFLAMAEVMVRDLGVQHAYMDTDSIFVPPEHAEAIIEYFQPLNPYSLDIGLLKKEKEDVWFYGISSKRYVLYRKEAKQFDLVDYKLHGLGHLMNPFSDQVSDWQGEIWEDILKLHYGYISDKDIWEKYGNFHAVSRMTVSTSNLLKWFKGLNKGKEWREQVKPFNFFCLGFSARKEQGKIVKPLCPFSRDSQGIVHEPFIDYETGKIMQGSEYFKTLAKTILQYIDHPESKFNGDIGLLERKHIHVDGVLYIGKEANSIDEQALEVKQAQTFMEKEEIYQKILYFSQAQAEDIGVRRGTLSKIKTKIREGRDLNLKKGAVKKLVNQGILSKSSKSFKAERDLFNLG